MFGINTVQGAYVESVDVEAKTENKVLLDSEGAFGEAMNYDPVYTFTVKGKGAINENTGIDGGSKPTLVPSGLLIVTSIKHSQNNEDWESYEYSATVYPYATQTGCN